MDKEKFVEKMVESFIDSLDQHGSDWEKGWLTTGNGGFIPKNGVTGAEYTGSNVFTLMALGKMSGYESNKWATYKQWQSEGKQVLKGEKASGWVQRLVTGTYEDKNGEEQYYSRMKLWPVFNEEQLAGYERIEVPTKRSEIISNSVAEDFVNKIGAHVREGGDSAFYNVKYDFINMPPRWKFKDTSDATATQNYYSTLLHEHVHWTGHESRLDRDMNGTSFSKSYAYEELVAELGSVLLSLQLGLSRQPTPDHAKYINGWKTGLRDSPKALIKAMADAQKAVSYLQESWVAKVAAQ